MPASLWRITAVAIAAFESLGFLTTIVLLIFALLVVIERRRCCRAAVYSLGVVVTHLCPVRLRAQNAARHRPVRVLGNIRGTPPFTACYSASRSRFQPDNRVVRLSRLPGRHAGRRAARHRPARRHLDPAAGDVRAQRHAGDHHARRHLLRLAIRRLDHLDPDAHPGRGLLGDDLHRRLRHGEERPRRRRALHRGGRLVDRRHLRRASC